MRERVKKGFAFMLRVLGLLFITVFAGVAIMHEKNHPFELFIDSLRSALCVTAYAVMLLGLPLFLVSLFIGK